MPSSQGAAGFLQHPFTDGDDGTAFFGQRDELVGRDWPVFGAVPAQQGFYCIDAAIGQHLLGLVYQVQLAAFHHPP